MQDKSCNEENAVVTEEHINGTEQTTPDNLVEGQQLGS